MGILPDSHAIAGWGGAFSHDENSQIQRSPVEFVEDIITETIAVKLDTKALSSNSNTFCLVDMGCSTGPKTFISVENIIEAVKQKFISQGFAFDQLPNFLVFFNDLAFNDFNALFMSLPPERQYLAAGVPGSFHDRLFPESSLHFVHSSYALQWLSQVPEEVLNKDSPAWNGGRIYYSNASAAVAKAFTDQFAKEMGMFLAARAKELVKGGMMVLIMPSAPDGIPQSRGPISIILKALESCLVEMAEEGLISEDLVDSFNIPLYIATPKEFIELIERNGCFCIEKMESTNCADADRPNGYSIMMSLRTGMEGIISRHFGAEIIEELFHRFTLKTDELMRLLASSNTEGSQLTLILKRKC